MKRDLDLVRKILFVMEESEDIDFSFHSLPKVEGYSAKQIIHHMQIMSQADLLFYEKDIQETEYNFGHNRQPLKTKSVREEYSISWQGYEFIDTMRSDTIWKKVKDVMSKSGGFVFDLAVFTGKEYIKQAVLKQLQ